MLIHVKSRQSTLIYWIQRDYGTYIFRDIVQNIRFQWHVHVDCARNPANVALPNIKHSVYTSDRFPTDLQVNLSDFFIRLPCRCRT